MLRVLRNWALGLAAVLLTGAVAFVAFCAVDGVPRYPTPRLEIHVDRTAEQVARGARIGSLLCVSCHLDPGTLRMTGRELKELPPILGVAYSRNITRDPVAGIGSWTDGEIVYLLRTGIARDGTQIPPWMPPMPGASDEDLAAVVAWLRSDDPRLAPSPAHPPGSRLTLLSKVLLHVAFRRLPFPAGRIPGPSGADPVARGRYLATGLFSCFTCHSADFRTTNLLHPEQSQGFFGGGNELRDADGHPIYSPNITFDAQTGIGRWSREDFRRALRLGFGPDNRPLLYPMERYAMLSDEEMDSIFEYLRTIPVLHRPRRPRPPGLYRIAATASDGERVYYKYACYSCHGTNGAGLFDLRGAGRKYPTDEALQAWIRHPSRFLPDTKMPSWDGVIAEDEYPALVRYVRQLGAGATATPGSGLMSRPASPP